MRRSLFTPSASSALSSRNYRVYLYGNVFSVLGIWVQRLAIGWQAWELSESAIAVGAVAAAQFLPLIVLTPFFGVLADQIRPRFGAIVMHVLLALIAAILAALTFSGAMSIELLFVLSLSQGVANSAYSPIRLSLIPDLVPKEQFPSAVAISSVVFNLFRFIGPGIAGVIVAWYGLGFAYAVNAVTYLPVVLALAVIRIERTHEPSRSTGGYFDKLAEGLRYTRSHPAIRQVILLVGVSNCFGRGILELLPAFTAMLFQGGSGVLAVLLSTSGIGAVSASLLLSTGALRVRLRLSVLLGAIGVVVSMLLFSLSDGLIGGATTVALLGFFTTLVAVSSQSEVQIHVENRLRGRVLSLWTIIAIGGPAVGSVVGGLLATRVGPQYTALTFTLVSAVLVLLVRARSREPKATDAP